MNFDQMWKLHDNLKRLVEMDAVDVFQGNNIDIYANDVRSMLKIN